MLKSLPHKLIALKNFESEDKKNILLAIDVTFHCYAPVYRLQWH